jgi:hypothetical protein
MTTQKKQHQVRLPLEMEASFSYVVAKLTGNDSTLNKNDIMVRALEVLVMTELMKEFSVEEAVGFLNGVTPNSVKATTKLDWRPI